MYKLLIVDDEPLVQAGIKSMVKWSELDIEIIGTAGNGQVAYEMIQSQDPDIVITDIKMPVMSGLELVGKCNDDGRKLPAFIILTSYEDFNYVKTAIKYQVVDYLVKIELTSEALTETVKKAIERVDEQKDVKATGDSSIDSLYLIREQFYTRLLFNLFETENQALSQAKNMGIDFSDNDYIVGYIEIIGNKLTNMPDDKQMSLYTSCLQIASEIAGKYAKCHVASLDMKHFAIIFSIEDKSDNDKAYRMVIENAIEQISTMLFNYYSVTIHASVGQKVTSLMQISSSYQDAKQIAVMLDEKQPVIFAEDIKENLSQKNVFNISLFKEDIRKAYAEFDDKALYDIFTSIIDIFEGKDGYYVQALDAAGNVLYLSLSLLNNGEELVSEIFKDNSNGYRSLYETSSVAQIMDWLKTLRDGLCESMITHYKDYKNHIVVNVKRYISQHIQEKLTLNKVSEVFNISPSYLSVVFSKYNDVGFNDYISQCKIEEAKRLMKTGEYKVYEISDMLGYENAFYFSRVFKKVTGVAPRDYQNQV